MKRGLTISVLIPTLGREKEPVHTVKSLLKQTRVPDEIVVVDQNVPSFPTLDQLMASDPRLKHVRSPEPGCVPNYNRALHAATSDIVLFLDDDVEISSDLVEIHYSRFQEIQFKKGGVVGFAGRVEQPSGDQDPSRIKHVGRYHRWSGRVDGNFNALKPELSVDFATGGNMSFFREALLEIGGFDEGFDGNGYRFEQDVGLRLRAKGYRMEFEPRASLIHLMAPRGGARLTDKSIHTLYFVKNGIRLARKHSPPGVSVVLAGFLVLYSLLKSAYNRDIRILLGGIQGALLGLKESVT